MIAQSSARRADEKKNRDAEASDSFMGGGGEGMKGRGLRAATCSLSFKLSGEGRAPGVRKPPANFFECRLGVDVVPGVHCASIVIRYQRYFCLDCRTGTPPL